MIFNFGSINVDHVYRVASMPLPGETIPSLSYEKFLGGKGVNQSIAISKAGGDVSHIGAVGMDGDWALSEIERLGVETGSVSRLDCATGHAIIYVSDAGENQIVIEGGANRRLDETMVDQALSLADPQKDWVLLQNETNLTTYIAEQAASRDIKIAYAAAPFVAEVTVSILPLISLLSVNELELAALSQTLGVDENSIPVSELLVTRGSEGSVFLSSGKSRKQDAFQVNAVDTTGAGDTFFGSFLAIYADGGDPETALEYAAAVSAIQVTRAGAALAIPETNEVFEFLEKSGRT